METAARDLYRWLNLTPMSGHQQYLEIYVSFVLVTYMYSYRTKLSQWCEQTLLVAP